MTTTMTTRKIIKSTFAVTVDGGTGKAGGAVRKTKGEDILD